jgi:cysteinyl-tRNA synthetase
MQLYNTLTRQKEEFKQISDPVRIYVCGVTTYDEPHLGHALSTVVFEVLHSYMEYRGMNVKRVQNFTDVDDKIIDRAADNGVDWFDLTQDHVASFFEAMDGLNVKRADVHPRVTEEMEEIIALIGELVDSDAAYEAGGSVYYRVRKNKQYGKLSGRTVDGYAELARLEPDLLKENPEDFALWKAWKPGEPSWDSPWGPGRPGWHIECSAMARCHLGDQVDIHGGGLDLMFPHHENEVAQSESATGVIPFARFWLHNGLLQMGGDQKMSKSLGNFVTVREALKTHTSDAIRLWICQSHYRSPATYDAENLAAAERAVRRLRQAANAVNTGEDSGEVYAPDHIKLRFIEAMDDDLNTPRAVAAIFDLTREIFTHQTQSADISVAQATLRELTGVLGLTLKEPESSEDVQDTEIEVLIERRRQARTQRDYATADQIREQLAGMGIEISDTPQGTAWRRI